MSNRRRTVRVSLPLHLVVAAERDLLAVMQAGVPAFPLTRAVFVAMLFEHAHFDLMRDRHVGRGKKRRLVPGPDRESAQAVARSYVTALIEE